MCEAQDHGQVTTPGGLDSGVDGVYIQTQQKVGDVKSLRIACLNSYFKYFSLICTSKNVLSIHFTSQ